HAGGDLDDPDRLTRQLQPQHTHERVRGELGRVVAATTSVGDMAGDRRDGDDVCMRSAAGIRRCRPLTQQRKESTRHSFYRDDVDIEHARPVFRVTGLDGCNPEGTARIVDERVYGSELAQIVAQGIYLGLVGEVCGEDVCTGLG